MDPLDNCPNDFNPLQQDTDGDGISDACDPFPNDPDNEQAMCDLDLTTCDSDLTICGSDFSMCSADLDTAEADLDTAQADLGQCLDWLDMCLLAPPGGLIGDINQDGAVNIVDPTLLRRQLAGEPLGPPHPAVTYLKLRNATTDLLIETVQNGDVWSLSALGGCLAIEIGLTGC